MMLRQQEQILAQQEEIQTIRKFIEYTVSAKTLTIAREETKPISTEEPLKDGAPAVSTETQSPKPYTPPWSVESAEEETQEPLRKKQEPIEEPLKYGTPAVSTEIQGRELSLRPPPVGSYKDLEQTPGGIDNLRKYDYKKVFSTLDSVLKHSARLSI